MDTHTFVVELAAAADLGRAVAGGKATVLAELIATGFAIPAGMVVLPGGSGDPTFEDQLVGAARRLGADRFAVRSSAAAEDLADASYAGLYETYLNVPEDGLGEAVRRCFAAAGTERVASYQRRRGGTGTAMAVLVQAMIDATVAGVAFTAHPVTGDRAQTIVTAVRGLGEPLVSGQTVGEEWTVTSARSSLTRPAATSQPVLTAGQAEAVAVLAGRVADRYGEPQDVEWAIDGQDRLWLLQARPMTALPDPVAWDRPGPGLWMRNFRLGEWLPEAVTPLFATWLLPVLEDGFLEGMQATVGVRVPFRWALVNGWYYNAAPIPSPVLLARVLWRGRRHAVRVLYNALVRVGRDPVGADRAVLSGLARQWREQQAPRYRQLVADAASAVETAEPQQLIDLVDRLGREAGISNWYLAIVGGSAWKMEAALTRFVRQYLSDALPDVDGGAQILLRGLPGAEPTHPPHAVHSLDWFHPVAGELPALQPTADVNSRHNQLVAQRLAAEQRCTTALTTRPRLLTQYQQLIEVAQRYAVLRELQAQQLTLAWPVLRSCAHRLGRHLADAALIDADDVFFCTRAEIAAATSQMPVPASTITERRDCWQRQRRLPAPLTLGRPPKLIGDVIERTVQRARGPVDSRALIVGHPASAGQATGPVRILTDPNDAAGFADGDILVATATTPAWTPLFARAAAIVTDGGTLAAHASLVAREYGIPAVVGTGDATRRLRTGQRVTVNGTTGAVTAAGPP